MFPLNVFWNNVKRNFVLALLASKPWDKGVNSLTVQVPYNSFTRRAAA